MSTEPTKNTTTTVGGFVFDFRRLLYSILSNWYWIILSLLLAVTIAYAYVRYKTPIYEIRTTLLLENKDEIASSVLADVPGINDRNRGDKRMFNEIFILKSKDLHSNVVDSLNLNVHYFIKGRIKEREMYQESPIKVYYNKEQGLQAGAVEFIIKQQSDKTFTVQEGDQTFKVKPDEWFQRSWGAFKIQLNTDPEAYTGYLKEEIRVVMEPISSAVSTMLGQLVVRPSDGRTSMLDIILKDHLPVRSRQYLNALIVFYHRNELEGINRIAKKTREFILARQQELGKELMAVEQKVEGIQVSSGLTSADNVGALMSAKTSAMTEADMARLSKAALNNLKASVLSGEGKTVSTQGVSDPQLSALVNEYNRKTIAADELLRNTGPDNLQYQKSKEDVRLLADRIAEAADRAQHVYDVQLRTAQENASFYESQARRAPQVEREVKSVKRGYSVMENVYLMLYQKSIDNEIQLYAATNKSKVIVEPYFSSKPVEPIRNSIYTMAFVLGLVLPMAFLVGKELLNNKVLNENEIKALTTIPIMGVISKHEDADSALVTGENIRTGISEQFRLARTNLEFMGLNPETGKKVLLVTSSMSGEGKSFFSLNLALTLALSQKRVLLMEFDLRKPKISDRLNVNKDGGISSYLAGLVGLDKVIKPSGIQDNLYIANCGPIPPNPGELIVLPRNKQMFDELKKLFDYIIIDTAPIGLVPDAINLARHSDVNLFVIRQDYTLKPQVKMLDSIVRDGRMHNTSIVFNGVESSGRYGYSSNYGYGYGYGYGYIEDAPSSKNKKGLFGKIKGRKA